MNARQHADLSIIWVGGNQLNGGQGGTVALIC